MDSNTMEYFDDQFDILDDPYDFTDDCTTHELNRYFREGRLNSMIDAIVVTEEEMIEDDDQFNDQNILKSSTNETILSQKLNQLSTKIEESNDDDEKEEYEQTSSSTNNKRRLSTTTSTSDVRSKKIKLATEDDNEQQQQQHNDGDSDDIDKNKQDQIPAYLLTTNECFIQLTKEIINTKMNLISFDDLQQVALFIHNIANIHMQKQISMIYYKSGTGTLREPEPEIIPIDRCVWPKQVKLDMLEQQQQRRQSATDTTAIVDIARETEHADYEKFLSERFHEMEKKIQHYKRQLDKKKCQLASCFTSTIEQKIKNYVFQYGIKPLQMKRDLKIALVKHDYDAEIIERKFLQEEPNDYQIQIAKRLYEARNELEKSKRTLLELKQRVFYNKPHISYNNSVHTSTNMTSTTTTTIHDNNRQQQFLQKVIQRKKLDLMTGQIVKMETKLYQCQTKFDDELSTMWQNHRNLVRDKGMPTTLSNLIEQRFTNITNRWEDIYNSRINYHLKNFYGDWDAIEKIQKQQTNKNDENNNSNQNNDNEHQMVNRIGFQPRIIIDTTTTHPFTDQQIQLLSRGPTYVPPCQMHISSSSSSSSSMSIVKDDDDDDNDENILKREYAPLKHQIAWLFDKYKVHISLHSIIQTEFYDQFKQCFSMPIPSHIEKRARYEMKLIQTIRQLLKTNHLILRRTADNMNTFYLGNSHDFERRADHYLTETTNDYQVFFPVDEENTQQQLQIKINGLIYYINDALTILRRRCELTEDLYHQFYIDMKKVQLPYLYFLPDVSKEGNDITLIPMITSQHNLTYKISKFLDQLLRPFALKHMESGIFHDEVEFIQKLNQYANIDHRLTPTTKFFTIKISNYFTLDTHENMIHIVHKFIQDNSVTNKLEKIPISAIRNLLQLCLYNHIFCYEDKIYQCTKGGPATLPLMDTLSNIYLYVWQTKMVNEIQQKQKELFGRYKDQIFFTWNNTIDELRSFLATATERYPNVHIQILFGPSIDFLNAYIANQNGQLYTCVYHNAAIQSYTLPYVIGHSKVNHSDWIRSALLRAVCYCPLIEDFNQERIYIELTCLANGYSYQFVESRIVHFYDFFQAQTLRYSMNQTMYEKFRRQWFDFIDMQRPLSSKLQKFYDTNHLIRFNYFYEFGSRCQFHEEFHQLWMKYFGTHPVLCKEKMAMILTSKHRYSLNALLTQQKSFCWLSI